MRKLKNLISKYASPDSVVWPLMRTASSAMFYYRYLRYQKCGNPLRNFLELYIEPVGYCNLRCRWCALDHTKPKKRFDLRLFQQVINEILSDQRLKSIQWIHLHNGGESSLHPHLEEMLIILSNAKHKAAQHGSSFPKVSLLSNGTVYRKELAKVIGNSKAIDLLRFSMDGGSPEMYEFIRNRAKWSVFRDNVLSYIQAARTASHPPSVEFICLLSDEQKAKDLLTHPEFSQILQLADDYEVRYAHDWAGQLSGTSAPVPHPIPFYRRGCRLLLNSLVVLADGTVTVCCADLNGRGVIGTYGHKSLAELFVSNQRLQVVEKIAKGLNAEIPLCHSCEGF